jgi:hypothetical protein
MSVAGSLVLAGSGGHVDKVNVSGLPNRDLLYPEFLPGGQDLIFFLLARDDSATNIFKNNLGKTGEYLARYRDGKVIDPILLLVNETAARYTPAGDGRLLFIRNDNLYSQKLNRSTRKLDGEATLLAEGVASNPTALIRRGEFSVARNGTVVWRPGRTASSQVTVFDHSGRPIATAGPRGSFGRIELSPDQTRLLVVSDAGSNLMEVGQPGLLPLPSQAYWWGWLTRKSKADTKLWGRSPDAILETDATGSGEPRAATEYSAMLSYLKSGTGYVADIGPDGTFLIAHTPGLVAFRPVAGPPGKMVTLVDNAEVFTAKFSPDGRWVVYWLLRESGIYVQPIDAPGARRQIAASGRWPVWRKDGKEILYVNEQSSTLMSIPVEGNASALRFGSPRTLFSGLRRPAGAIATYSPLATSHDGSRIFWIQGPEETESNVIHVQTNAIR